MMLLEQAFPDETERGLAVNILECLHGNRALYGKKDYLPWEALSLTMISLWSYSPGNKERTELDATMKQEHELKLRALLETLVKADLVTADIDETYSPSQEAYRLTAFGLTYQGFAPDPIIQ